MADDTLSCLAITALEFSGFYSDLDPLLLARQKSLSDIVTQHKDYRVMSSSLPLTINPVISLISITWSGHGFSQQHVNRFL